MQNTFESQTQQIYEFLYKGSNDAQRNNNIYSKYSGYHKEYTYGIDINLFLALEGRRGTPALLLSFSDRISTKM